MVGVTTQQGVKKVVEMLTCADLVHGKKAYKVVKGRITVDPEFIKGQHLQLGDAMVRNIRIL